MKQVRQGCWKILRVGTEYLKTLKKSEEAYYSHRRDVLKPKARSVGSQSYKQREESKTTRSHVQEVRL